VLSIWFRVCQVCAPRRLSRHPGDVEAPQNVCGNRVTEFAPHRPGFRALACGVVIVQLYVRQRNGGPLLAYINWPPKKGYQV
jgi:hypothetical protein